MFFHGELLATCEIGEGICQKPGCGKLLDASQQKHRYCSRRHFYKHLNQRKLGEDMWKKAAQTGIMTLATQGAEEAGVEAAGMEQAASGNTATDDYRIALTLLVLFLFSFIGVKTTAYEAYMWVLSIAQVIFPKPETEIEHQNENDEVPENDLHSSHGAIEEIEVAQNDHERR